MDFVDLFADEPQEEPDLLQEEQVESEKAEENEEEIICEDDDNEIEETMHIDLTLLEKIKHTEKIFNEEEFALNLPEDILFEEKVDLSLFNDFTVKSVLKTALETKQSSKSRFTLASYVGSISSTTVAKEEEEDGEVLINKPTLESLDKIVNYEYDEDILEKIEQINKHKIEEKINKSNAEEVSENIIKKNEEFYEEEEEEVFYRYDDDDDEEEGSITEVNNEEKTEETLTSHPNSSSYATSQIISSTNSFLNYENKSWVDTSSLDESLYNKLLESDSLAFKHPFNLDTFQKQAIMRLEMRENVFIAAHTSAGKTVIADYSIALAIKNNRRVIYTSPIKTLSNQKYNEFCLKFGKDNIGIVTGDVSINPTAMCLILTTEIFRSMLYNNHNIILDIMFVIFDEIHYINDFERGVVWEEILLLLPFEINLIFLSATTPNSVEFCEWIGNLKKRKIAIIQTLYRPVPLIHFYYFQKNFILLLNNKGTYNTGFLKDIQYFRDKVEAKKKSKEAEKVKYSSDRQLEKATSMAKKLNISQDKARSIIEKGRGGRGGGRGSGSRNVKGGRGGGRSHTNIGSKNQWIELIRILQEGGRQADEVNEEINFEDFANLGNVKKLSGELNKVENNKKELKLSDNIKRKLKLEKKLSTRYDNLPPVLKNVITDEQWETYEYSESDTDTDIDVEENDNSDSEQEEEDQFELIEKIRQKLEKKREKKFSKQTSSSSSSSSTTPVEDKSLLPAIVFCFSKKKCETLAENLSSVNLLNKNEQKYALKIFNILKKKLDQQNYTNIQQITQIKKLILNGIGVHHSGLLFFLKEIVEILFSLNLIKVLFATETFSIGINMPSRTVIFLELTKHDGNSLRFLNSSEYIQMAGRAGRRNKDKYGIIIILNFNETLTYKEEEIRRVLTGKPNELISKFRLRNNMLLNLIKINNITLNTTYEGENQNQTITNNDADNEETGENHESSTSVVVSSSNNSASSYKNFNFLLNLINKNFFEYNKKKNFINKNYSKKHFLYKLYNKNYLLNFNKFIYNNFLLRMYYVQKYFLLLQSGEICNEEFPNADIIHNYLMYNEFEYQNHQFLIESPSSFETNLYRNPFFNYGINYFTSNRLKSIQDFSLSDSSKYFIELNLLNEFISSYYLCAELMKKQLISVTIDNSSTNSSRNLFLDILCKGRLISYTSDITEIPTQGILLTNAFETDHLEKLYSNLQKGITSTGISTANTSSTSPIGFIPRSFPIGLNPDSASSTSSLFYYTSFWVLSTINKDDLMHKIKNFKKNHNIVYINLSKTSSLHYNKLIEANYLNKTKKRETSFTIPPPVPVSTNSISKKDDDLFMGFGKNKKDKKKGNQKAAQISATPINVETTLKEEDDDENFISSNFSDKKKKLIILKYGNYYYIIEKIYFSNILIIFQHLSREFDSLQKGIEFHSSFNIRKLCQELFKGFSSLNEYNFLVNDSCVDNGISKSAPVQINSYEVTSRQNRIVKLFNFIKHNFYFFNYYNITFSYDDIKQEMNSREDEEVEIDLNDVTQYDEISESDFEDTVIRDEDSTQSNKFNSNSSILIPSYKNNLLYNLVKVYQVQFKAENLSYISSNKIFFLYNELILRIKLLKLLNYLDFNNFLTIKGKVSIEINTCDEVIGTEILFYNLLDNLNPIEIVSILSCLIYDEKLKKDLYTLSSDSSFDFLPSKIHDTKEKIIDIYEDLVQLYELYEIQNKNFISINNYDNNTKPAINFDFVPIVYLWGEGHDFATIVGTTDIQEGIIVRTILRLIELCNDMKKACLILGNPKLYNKLEAGIACIKRDIIYTNSLYL